VTQTNGNATIGSNHVLLNGNAVWYLQGGLLSSGSGDISIGYTDNPISNATVNISGGTLNAGRALNVQYQSLLEQTGGNITAGSMKIYSGSKVNVGGGTATITTNLTISGSSSTNIADSSRLTLSGGSWTIDGTLEFHTNLRGSGLVFAEGDASLTANNLTFNSGYIDFVTGSDGSLTVTSFTDAADFDGFINAGQIRIDGKIKTASDFNIVGNTIMIPEPAALSMFLISGLALITYRRMR
ncbi:MAG: hypothetical protein WC959_08910, partial [Kiritimatiellales bacterium]